MYLGKFEKQKDKQEKLLNKDYSDCFTKGINDTTISK